MVALLISVGAFVATMFGGALALKLKDRLHLILGFSAGAVVAVAFFDLMPEALTLGSSLFGGTWIFTIVAMGFFLYLVLDRLLMLHSHSLQHVHTSHDEELESRGDVRAGSLSLHSFLDGVGLGLAFQVSAAVGAVLALAVLTHDFSDGVNTVSVVVRDGGTYRKALKWLLVDALAPIAGVLVTFLFAVNEQELGGLLALFAGFFLYIGASDLVPESQHAHPTFWTTVMTILGASVLFVAIKLANV